MINRNLIQSESECVVEMGNVNEYLRLDYTGDSLRVTDNAGYIKLHAFAPKGKGKFRVTIKVENIRQYEVNRYNMERQTERIEDND